MIVKLSDAFDLQMGKTPDRNDPACWGGAHKWVSIADLTKAGKYITDTKECITDRGIEKSGIKPVPKGTVIMSFKLSIGKTAITTEEIYTNEAIMAFIDKGTYEIDTNYIYHLFSGKDWLEGSNKAVLGLTLNKATLSQKTIELPPLAVQKKVVEVLDRMDTLISLRKKQLQKLDDLVKSRFVEMFGDPNTNPMGWTEYPLSEMLNILGGYAFRSEGFCEADGIPVLRIGNINAGFFKPVNMVFWEEDESLERYIMYPGDLVMSLTGTVGKDDYGNVCMLGNDYDKYYLNQRNAKLELKEGLDKHYLSQLLRFEKIKKRLTGISRGVRQANISNKDILGLIVPIPPIALQWQYATFVTQVDKSKLTVQQGLDKLELLKQSLMQKYFG